MLKALANVFKIEELRKKIFFTLGVLLIYRLGAYIPVPGIPFQGMYNQMSAVGQQLSSLTLLNLFSGGALSRVSVFSLGIMPYITSEIIMQMMQVVIPSLGELAREGEAGQRRITQYTRYLTVALSAVSAVGYMFLFKSASYGISFANTGIPEIIMDIVVVVTMVTGAMIIMWMGEMITTRGIGNGMSLIIFTNIMSGIPSSLIQSLAAGTNGPIITALVLLVTVLVIPFIVHIERGQRRIPIQYAKRVIGRRVMGGQSTYLPIKVNTAGVIPIIFASAVISLPAQLAVFFPNVGWINAFANAVSSGPINWVITVLLVVAFAYFYTSMVFNPDETADQLRKNGGFIQGVRPGAATAAYIRDAVNKITLPGAMFMAGLAVIPSIVFMFTSNQLIQTFGGTTILIMVGVALDTISQLEGQLKMHNYDGFFK